MDSLEQRVTRNGKAYVIESIRTRIRFHEKRKATILQTIATCEQRLDEIREVIKDLENDLSQLEDPIDTSDIPELDKDFFKNATLTRPGESLIKKED